MEAITILTKEHRVIERMIGVLEAGVDEGRKAGRLDGETARAALAFIREYADGLHHKKEEELLFEALADAGLPKHGGPVAVMLLEHDEGRSAVAAMGRSLEGAAAGDAAELECFAGAAGLYARLLRQHIMKEDGILYPMAEDLLAPDSQEALAAAFKRVDAQAAELKRRHEAAAAGFARRFGVPEPAPRDPSAAPFCR